VSTGLMTPGFSQAAQYVEREALEGWRKLNDSNVFGIESTIRDDLGSVWDECRRPDWDGFGALPVSQETLRNAYTFLESLPLGCPVPSVGAEPDGQLTLEWHRGPRRTLSVSVTPEGDLHYAALSGRNRVFGTEAFFGEAPSAIIHLIRRIYAS
jgi:hypothetical protein